jgi:exonuclease SbcC
MSYHFTRLRVKNFGQHIDKEIYFKPGVNVIIGESESGKTTLIRALHLLLENSPRGGEKLYKSDDSKGDVFIELEDSLGNVVSRSKNIYTLNGEEYRAIGSGVVPEPIRKIFGLKEINWQRQLEAHFMLFKTGNAAAMMLNQTTGMEEQELILKEIKNRISDGKSNIKRLKKNNEELQQTLERLFNVPNYLENAVQLKNEQKKYLETSDTIVRLDAILNKHAQIIVIRKLYEISKKHILKLKNIEKVYNEWNDSNVQMNRLENLINKINDRQEVLKKTVNITNHTRQFNELREFEKENQKSLGSQARLNDLIAEIQMTQAYVFDSANNIKILEEEKEKKFKELGYCPLCERKI